MDSNLPEFYGSATLLEDLNEKILVSIRGGRAYIGYLKIVDQFGNIVLYDAVERIHVYDKFCDVPVGIILIRGENVILIGKPVSIAPLVDIIYQKTDYDPEKDFFKVPEEEIFKFQAEKVAALEEAAAKRRELFKRRGIYLPCVSDILFEDN